MKRATLTLSIFLFLPLQAFAAVEITDVMYDAPGSDAGREWIQITNKGESSVDLAKWKLLEGGVKHTITASQGSSILLPGAGAIIASDPVTYQTEHPDFLGTIFKSSFSLSNTGETLSLLNDKGVVESSHTYTATKGTLMSLATKKATPLPKAKKSTPPSTHKFATSSNFAAVSESLPKNPQATSLLPWLAGLGGLVLLGVAGVFIIPQNKIGGRETKSEAEEFDIE